MNKVPRLSELQQVPMLEEEERKEELKEQLVKFVNRTVFPSTKFPLGREKEEKLCRIAAYRLKVKLPAGVDRQVFGTKFFMTVHLKAGIGDPMSMLPLALFQRHNWTMTRRTT